jgi:Domain of unknown function (DUF1330)
MSLIQGYSSGSGKSDGLDQGYLEEGISRKDYMTAYLIVQQTIRDATKLEEYRTKVAPMLARYEGRFLTKRWEA